MLDVGFLEGMKAGGERGQFARWIDLERRRVVNPAHFAASSEEEGPNPQSEKSKSFSLRV